jgi:hypothetical protein
LQGLLKICEIKKEVMNEVKKSSLLNFDDAVYFECSSIHKIDAIVTLNPEKFEIDNISHVHNLRAFTPSQYVSKYYCDDIQFSSDEVEDEIIAMETPSGNIAIKPQTRFSSDEVEDEIIAMETPSGNIAIEPQTSYPNIIYRRKEASGYSTAGSKNNKIIHNHNKKQKKKYGANIAGLIRKLFNSVINVFSLKNKRGV